MNSSQTSGDAFSDTSEPLEVAGELAQVFWEYSVDGEEVEYLAENEVSTQEYTLHIAETYFVIYTYLITTCKETRKKF